MNFWETYNRECLQTPWMIAGEGSKETAPLQPNVLEPKNHKVFIFIKGSDQAQLTMMGKMIHALKFAPDEVSLIELAAADVSSLQWRGSKKILFFGRDYPGLFGDWMHWQGHEVLQTYSLTDLSHNPGYKKETWAHLQKYAGAL